MCLIYVILVIFFKYFWLLFCVVEGGFKLGKYSVFFFEVDVFQEVCVVIGFRELVFGCYCCYLFVYLMEVVDDFCYVIIDLEDGLEMDLLYWDEVYVLLQFVLLDNNEVCCLVYFELCDGCKVVLLCGKIIEWFIEVGVEVFVVNYEFLLVGGMDGDLLYYCELVVYDVVENVKQLVCGKVFEYLCKIEFEIGVFEVMGVLLDGLIEVLLFYVCGVMCNYWYECIIDLIGCYSFLDGLVDMDEQMWFYQCIMWVLDFFVGMIDNYVIYLVKQFFGMVEMCY